MGGDHTFITQPRDVSRIEKIFKNVVDEAVKASSTIGVKSRNIFISFAMEDESQVNLLRYQAKNPNLEMTFRDYSIKEPFDDKWKSRARERILKTSATIFMISEDSVKSEAVKWEVEETVRQGKKVFGVRVYSDRHTNLPLWITQFNIRIINWTADGINELLSQI